jgi:uncharacterized membrane protein YkoI
MALPQDINDCNYRKHREITSGVAVSVIDDSLPTEGDNASMTVATSVVGTVTTTTLTKTIGSTSYEKTIEEDSSDNSIVISAWSEV